MEQQRDFFIYCKVADKLWETDIIANTKTYPYSKYVEDLKGTFAVLEEAFLAAVTGAAYVPFIVFSFKASGRSDHGCCNGELVGASSTGEAIADVTAQVSGKT